MRAQFVLSEIGVGLRRNLTMTFAVIISVALSLALSGGALLANKQVDSMKGYWYDKVQVSIYMCNKSDADVDPQLRQGRGHRRPEERRSRPTCTKLPIVEKVYYESPEAGLQALPGAVQELARWPARSRRTRCRSTTGSS